MFNVKWSKQGPVRNTGFPLRAINNAIAGTQANAGMFRICCYGCSLYKFTLQVQMQLVDDVLKWKLLVLVDSVTVLRVNGYALRS